MKSVILPFTIDVELRPYHNKAFPIGIAKANMADYDIWLCNKFINSYMSIRGDFNSYDEDQYSLSDGFGVKRAIELPTPAFDNKGIDLVALNKAMIKEGWYINGNYNEFYIKGKKPYNSRDFNHDYIIFGYDDEQKVFKSAAYMADGSYSYYDIDYENYHQSIIGSKTERVNVRYYQVNKDYSPTLDIKGIKENLCNYLYSRKDAQGTETNYFWGMEAWAKFMEYIENIGESKLDCRYSRCYMEHRAVMLKRIKKLLELGYLKDVELYEEYSKSVCLPAKTVHYLFIKYNVSQNTKVIPKIVEMVLETNENEALLIRKFVEELG